MLETYSQIPMLMVFGGRTVGKSLDEFMRAGFMITLVTMKEDKGPSEEHNCIVPAGDALCHIIM